MTILILHGWGVGAKNWKLVKELLENQGYKVFVPDLPGFGGSSPPPQVWTIDDYVNWVKEFSEKQNLSRFFLLGYSFGGRISIKFALKYPEKLLGLILVSCAGIKHNKTFKQLVISKIAKWGNKFSFCPFYCFFRKIFYRLIIRKSDYFGLKGSIKETFKRVIEEDLTPYLSQIKVSTLIVWGKEDRITPLKDAYLIKEKIFWF